VKGAALSDSSWLQVSQAVQNWVTAVGIVVGGGWALYRFGLRRESESALNMDLLYSTTPCGAGSHLLFCDVNITNSGAVRIKATEKRQPAQSDHADRLEYAADLLLRRLPDEMPPNTPVPWFGRPAASSPQPGDLELDLLDAIELGTSPFFWMEPKESYHLSAGAVLVPGSYLALVTFVGSKKGEFWRRLFLLEVPKPADSSAQAKLAAT
jgi:hypothetical protein